MPCVGTADRDLILDDMFAEISAWKLKLNNCGCVLAGDFNSDLDGRGGVSEDINKFLADNNLIRCDLQHPGTISYTFVNEAMTHKIIKVN